MRVVKWLLLALAASVGVLVLLNLLMVRRLEIPAEGAVASNGPPPHRAEASELNLQLAVALPALEQLIEANVPRRFEQELADPTARLTGAKLKFQLNRGPVKLTALPDGSIGFTAPITDGAATMQGQLNAGTGATGLLTGLQRQLSQPFAQTVNFSGTISGSIAPRLRADWTIEPGLKLHLNLDKADTALFGLPLRISFREQAEAVVATVTSNAIVLLNARLARDPRIRDAAAAAWARVNTSHALSAAPPVWLVLVPQTAGSSVPQASAGYVNLSLRLGVMTDVLLASAAPPVPAVPLPPLTELPGGPGNFRVALPVAVQLSALAAMGEATTVKIGDREVRIGDVTLSGSGSAVLAAADIDADAGRFLGGLKARVYLSGRPELDLANGQVRLTDLRYTVRTQSALARSAAWLLQPVLLRQLQRRAVFAVPGGRDGVIRLANARLAEVQAQLPSGTAATLKLDALDAGQVAVQDAWLTVFITASGPAVLRIDSTERLLGSGATPPAPSPVAR